jgi:nuclear GTP-binding protein
MGTGKKESNRRIRQGKTGDGLANVRVKGENFYRYVRMSYPSLSNVLA